MTENNDTQPNITAPKSKFPFLKSAKTKKTLVTALIFLVFVALLGVGLVKNKSKIFVARVDNAFILRSELETMLEDRYGQNTLEDLITITLVRRELAKAKIQVTKEEVDAQLKEVEDSLQGVTLENALQSQGMTLADYRKQVEMQVGLEKLLADKIVTSEEDIKNFLAKYGSELSSKDAEGKRQEAMKILKEQKTRDVVDQWVTELKANAKVEKFL